MADAMEQTDIDSLRNLVNSLAARIAMLEGKTVDVEKVDEFSSDLGDMRAGRFIAAVEGTEPTDSDFTGVFMAATPETFAEGDFNIAGLNAGAVQFGLRASDGAAMAGAGAVQLDKDGIAIEIPAIYNAKNSIKWLTAGVAYGIIYTTDGGTAISLRIETSPKSGENGNISISAVGDTGKVGQIILQATHTGNTNPPRITLDSTANTIVLNSAGYSVDVSIQGDTDVSLLYADASTDRVGIGTPTPSVKLDVVGAVKASLGFDATSQLITNVLKPSASTDAANKSYVDIMGGNASPTTVTGSSATVGSPGSVICNYAGTVTLTLPDASLYPGQIIWIKTITANTVISAASNVRPLNSNTSGTAILAATAGKWAMLQSNGVSVWYIMAGN